MQTIPKFFQTFDLHIPKSPYNPTSAYVLQNKGCYAKKDYIYSYGV
jgi:hypothetical protein